MSFARKVWKLLVAIKDGLALLVLVVFFSLIAAALSMRPNAATVQPGALLLKLNGAIVEETADTDPLQYLVGNGAPMREYAARDIIRALDTATTDDRIKAVAIDLTRFTGAGAVHLHDIGAALDRVRARKPVLTFAQLYTDDGIQIAAHASEVWLDPYGAAIPTGPGGTTLFYGPLLDRLKVKAHVYKVGTYKSAVEPYTRGDLSPPARENLTAIYAALWDTWKADVTRARPKANLALATGDPVAWLNASGKDSAKAALAAGLVDLIGDETAFGDRVAQIAGKSTASTRPGSFAHTGLSAWLAANPPETPGRAIGVVTIAGTMVPGDAGPGTAGGDRITRLLDDALGQNLAALVVRVDSPGGAAVAGEEIRAAIARYKDRRIPVVVSMANLSASAGYWVTTPAQRIFAEPATITGSIGIFAIVPSFEDALGQYGIKADGVRTTPLSGQPDIIGGFSPQFDSVIQASIEHTYGRFLQLVGDARGKTPAQVDAIAQGRVWDGGTARQLGLVDQFGNLDDALAYAAHAAGLKPGGWHPQYLGQEKSSWSRLFARFTSNDDDDTTSAGAVGDWAGLATARQIVQLRAAVAGMTRMATAGGIQAYCLECPVIPSQPPAVPVGRLELLARLAGFRTE